MNNTRLETARETASSRSAASFAGITRPKTSNPFKIPDDQSLLYHREQLRNAKEEKRMLNANSTLATRPLTSRRQNLRSLTKQREQKASAEEEALAQIILSPDSNERNEGLHDFIQQKREIFLAQLAIDTKREELQRLERLEREEEESLKAKEAEINLFKDQFRSFLEHDGKATMDARVAAEAKAKQRLELTMKIKLTSAQIFSLRNEIAHHEEKLKECMEYKKFLEDLTPPEWKKEHKGGEMYFKDPAQLLEIIQSLEEQNMFLLRHCQEAEEAVERTRQVFNAMLESRDHTIVSMTEQKQAVESDLDSTVKFNRQFGEIHNFKHGNELSDAELAVLTKAIHQYYGTLGFDASASNDVVTMLTRIENKMVYLINEIRGRDPAQVRLIFQKQEKRRREQVRIDKAEELKKIQNEKRQKALALATKPITRKTGRPVIARTMPKVGKSKQEKEEEQRRLEAQEKADNELLFGEIEY